MKFKVKQKELEKALEKVIKACPAKTTIELLQSVKLEISEDQKLLLTCNDTQLAIETSIPCEIEEAGTPFCVNANLFYNVVRKIPEGIVNIVKENTITTVRQGKLSFALQSLSPESFPNTPDISGDVVEMAGIAFRGCVQKTIFAVNKGDNNPVLKGIRLMAKEDEMSFFACDGLRISLQTVKLKKPVDSEKTAIIPGEIMSDIAKILPAEDKIMKIIFSDSKCMFSFEDTKIVSGTIIGKMPVVETILKTPTKTELNVNKSILLDSLDRGILFISGNDSMTFDLQANILNISLESNIGKFQDMIFANISGDELKINFNPLLLKDAIRSIHADEITIRFASALAPAFINGTDISGIRYDYVILPVNRRS